MKASILFFLCVLFFSVGVRSQHNIWSVGTAKTLDKRQYYYGIFEPLRYGLTKRVELQTYPLACVVFPNLSFKINWIAVNNNWYLSTRHAASYPTFGLRISQEQDFRELIPDTTHVPQMIGVTNEILFSKWLIPESSCEAADMLLTIKAGIKFAYKFEETGFPNINQSVIYHQAAIYRDSILWYVGIDLDGHAGEKMNFCLDLDFMSVNQLDDWAIQHKGMLIIPFGKRANFIIGYLINYGTYPDKNRIFAMPLIDLSWYFRGKKPAEKGLFDEDMQF